MLHSWERNARAWTDAVRERRIASRLAGTDAAVVEAVLGTHPASVLDVGCGEGWLARVLSAQGCRVTGIDASAALIDAARRLGCATFAAMSYADIATHHATIGAPFDVAVCNFSLLEADLAPVLRALRDVLAPHGRLIVQTVHPWIATGEHAYADGWRTETFAGFGEGFVEPMPWYFRTLSSWLSAIGESGFSIERVREPSDAQARRPLSLLIVAMSDRVAAI
jgi:2-polyprenyl-3-methyl-5-hydroxy-6-metoxy-1,4-benzoquinol methylase